ncbi:hypothetical protein ACF0H5_011682 [Mactra antiquata]
MSGEHKAIAEASNDQGNETTAVASEYSVGTWCAVCYDKTIYPGIIQDIDAESVQMKCMARIGHNRFFWPRIDDIIWYNWNDVIMSIPELTKVTDRHRKIDPDKFAVIEAQLNN